MSDFEYNRMLKYNTEMMEQLNKKIYMGGVKIVTF
jgi:hypothetical protein